MKKHVLRVIMVLVLMNICPISAAAGGVLIDGTIVHATNPYPGESMGFGSTTGYGVGVSKTFFNEELNKVKIAVRADISYFTWSERTDFLEWSLERLPLFAGLRIYRKSGLLEIYGEGGLELNFDRWESSYTGPLFGVSSPGQHSTHTERKFGLTPGVGVEIPFSNNMLIGIHARYHFHLMESSPSTYGISVGYRF